ncbi:SH3 domain-containing protein [Spirosoma flavum]|uniref:SH3 domain-containing protein n=1 Tax=Spirosoma flavum TaxID=2048557 RepID=A0ABW6AJX0_9BACT
MALFRPLQAISLKISLFFCFLSVLADAQIVSPDSLRRADSLFVSGDQIKAARIYEMALVEGHTATDPMLLKLASAYERQNDVPRLLYYLDVYFERHPDDVVLRRMNDIARANNLSGYETDDLNYFYLFYRKYGLYFLLFLLIPAGYVFTVLVLKLIRKQSVPVRQKWVVFIYLLLLLIFTNLPEGVQSGITSHDRVLLRTDPSAAAPVIDVIGRGHKVNILGTKDIYLRILWHNNLYFIRRDNVWII